MGMSMGVSFQYPMGMGMGMGMVFENRYGCRYTSTHPEPTPLPSLSGGVAGEGGGIPTGEGV